MLNKNIKFLREQKGLRVYQLAKLSGVDNAGLRKIESGHSVDPNVSTVIKLARTFGVSIDELVFNDLEKIARGGSTSTLERMNNERDEKI